LYTFGRGLSYSNFMLSQLQSDQETPTYRAWKASATLANASLTPRSAVSYPWLDNVARFAFHA
jgi:hypothetical protein